MCGSYCSGVEVVDKQPAAITRLPPQTQNALIALGAHLAVARVRRGQSLRAWAERVGVSVPTLMKLEAGDPSVSMGAYASALWLMGCDGELARIAEPARDSGALELDVSAAERLGAQRANRARTIALGRAQQRKTAV